MSKLFRNNPLMVDEIITAENVMRIGERIALKALKTVLSHSYNATLNNLYLELVRDVAKANNPDHTFSDGYDIAQSAACFLWEYAGKPLNEVCAYTVRGKKDTILNACFSHVNQIIMRQRKESRMFASNDSPEVINLSVSFKEEQEPEDYTAVDETIAKLNLIEGESDVLNCYLAGMGFEKIVSCLSVAVSTVWSRRKHIQRKYNCVMGTNY